MRPHAAQPVHRPLLRGRHLVSNVVTLPSGPPAVPLMPVDDREASVESVLVAPLQLLRSSCFAPAASLARSFKWPGRAKGELASYATAVYFEAKQLLWNNDLAEAAAALYIERSSESHQLQRRVIFIQLLSQTIRSSTDRLRFSIHRCAAVLFKSPPPFHP